jgi:hypothetical protein
MQETGFTTNYRDSNSGIDLPEAWVEVDNFLYVPYNYVFIVYNIYKDYSSYQNNMNPVFQNLRKQIDFGSNDWDAYFDPNAMDEAGHNILKQVINWLQINVSKEGRK